MSNIDCIVHLYLADYQIVYFDRIKTSYGTHRVITSISGGKIYADYASAEVDAARILDYYSADCIVEIIKENE